MITESICCYVFLWALLMSLWFLHIKFRFILIYFLYCLLPNHVILEIFCHVKTSLQHQSAGHCANFASFYYNPNHFFPSLSHFLHELFYKNYFQLLTFLMIPSLSLILISPGRLNFSVLVGSVSAYLPPS